MRVYFLFLSIALLALPACGSDSPIELRKEEPQLPKLPVRDHSPVQTDSLEYTLHRQPSIYHAEARAVYVNRTSLPVHFARCVPDATGPMFDLERIEPVSGRPPFVGSAWPCVGGVPTGQLAPGDSLVFRIWLGSTESPAAQPPITMQERTGVFRVLLRLCSRAEVDSDHCTPVATEDRQSNLFRINPPRS